MTRLAQFALIVGLALASWPAAAQERPRRPARVASIEFLDVGHGDAILIRSPEGRTALVDAGPHEDFAADLLRRRSVTSLDLVALSHHHADHFGGMEEVIRQFRPRVFLDDGSSHTTSHYLRLLELVRDRGIVAITPSDRALDRAGLGHPDGLPAGPGEPGRREPTTAWASGSSTVTSRPCYPATPSGRRGPGGSARSRPSARAPRS